LLNGDFTFCPIHDFNNLRQAKERGGQLPRDQAWATAWSELILDGVQEPYFSEPKLF
jgi:hypothetical protein